jgi:ferredoxin
MRKAWWIFWILAGVTSISAQEKRLWVLRAPGEMVEYDPATFAAKPTVKVPAEAVPSPQSIAINRLGQILFAPAVSLPLADTDIKAAHKAWFWNGHAASEIDLGVKQETAATGSNLAVTESAPAVFLSSDGAHLFWFANQQRRLQREDVDLSVSTTWQAWQTELDGSKRQNLTSAKLPECRCPTGACEESCPYGAVWLPENGLKDFFLLTQFVAGKDAPVYKATASYREENGTWRDDAFSNPLHRVLDAAANGEVIVEAIPDTGCCGWSNQSNDQTLLHANGKTLALFDEQSTYKNSDYDVSFFTSNARLSPDLASLAMTISATARLNQPIQLSEQGQGNPEELKQIRKALADLPAVEIKTTDDAPHRLAFLPHATLVGWIGVKEILIVEDHLLVAYNVATGARRKSTVRVEDAAHVFLR